MAENGNGREVIERPDWGNDDGLGFRGNDVVEGHRADGSSKSGKHVAQTTGIVRFDWDAKPEQEHEQADSQDNEHEGDVAESSRELAFMDLPEFESMSLDWVRAVGNSDGHDQVNNELDALREHVGQNVTADILDVVDDMPADAQHIILHAASKGPDGGWKNYGQIAESVLENLNAEDGAQFVECLQRMPQAFKDMLERDLRA